MKILITESEHFSSKAIDVLKSLGTVVISDIKDRAELIAALKPVDAAFIRLGFKIDKELLEQASRLKYILTATTGLDHIDGAYFKDRGGQIISLQGETEFLTSIPSTAEHTWALLLALIRHIPNAIDDVKKGYWRRDAFKGNNLSGKKLGILGMGRVGAQVSKYGQVFGMRIGFYDKKKINPEIGERFETAETLFKWADIISIHIPAELNEGFINAQLLSNLHSESLLINTSRGSVIEEAALATLIKERKIKGCALDVLTEELENKSINNKMVVLMNQGYNVLITPHIAGATYESMQMTEDYVSHKFRTVLIEDK